MVKRSCLHEIGGPGSEVFEGDTGRGTARPQQREVQLCELLSCPKTRREEMAQQSGGLSLHEGHVVWPVSGWGQVAPGLTSEPYGGGEVIRFCPFLVSSWPRS